jgi:hypothetical protein
MASSRRRRRKAQQPTTMLEAVIADHLSSRFGITMKGKGDGRIVAAATWAVQAVNMGRPEATAPYLTRGVELTAAETVRALELQQFVQPRRLRAVK